MGEELFRGGEHGIARGVDGCVRGRQKGQFEQRSFPFPFLRRSNKNRKKLSEIGGQG